MTSRRPRPNDRTRLTGEYPTKVARGAASELFAAADLMSPGYHVFRALASTCPVDLVAYKPGEAPLLVEVKSVTVDSNDSHWWAEPVNDQWDMLVVVTPDGFVASFPSSTTVRERAAAYRDARIAAGYSVPPNVERRSRMQCANGHEFPERNTTRRAADRFCKTCHSEGLIRLVDERTA